jgi:hypothetical protein
MKRFLLCIVVVAGCDDVNVQALTVPPPGKVAQLDAKNLELELSRGVAFAFECNESNNDYTGPCRDSTLTSDDAAIAQAFPSYLDSLAIAYGGGDLGPRSRSAFVVVGLAAGKTDLRLATPDKDLSIRVTVVP